MCELLLKMNHQNFDDSGCAGFIDQDPLDGLGDRNEEKFYKLDEIIFAEPIVDMNKDLCSENGKNIQHKMFTFCNKVKVERRVGKRNRYHIDIEDESTPMCSETNCKKQFSTITLLKAHMRKVHFAEFNHICEVCGMKFTAKYLLTRHQFVHDKNKVQCIVCKKLLSKRTNLSAHMRFVHRQGELKCDKCDQRFERRNQYVRHRASHRISSRF